MVKLDLPKYVISKLKGRYFYFRVVRPDETFYRRLPHPLEDGFFDAYEAAWAECFGSEIRGADPVDPTIVKSMVDAHMAGESFKRLSKNSQGCRRRAGRILISSIGKFPVEAIRANHMQAIYDKLSVKPRAANRVFDDLSAIFKWSIPRGYTTINPVQSVERIRITEGYEPWPMDALQKLVTEGRPEIVRCALVALYTGQSRSDVIGMCDSEIEGDVWNFRRSKTSKKMGKLADNSVALHPVVMSIIEEAREAKRKAGIIDPSQPILLGSRGTPWTGTGFGGSWNKEMKRLGLNARKPRLTFHGLRTTNATMIAEAASKGDKTASEVMAHVQSMLGHHSQAMAAHYARRAEIGTMNRNSVELLPIIKRSDT